MRTFTILGVVVWCVLLGFGVREMFAHATAPGNAGATPQRWPDSSTLARGADYTVIVFVHPECPCTRATLRELHDLVDDLRELPTLHIVFVGEAAGAWELAGVVRGATRSTDDGSEATRFGAQTSGYVVVYDRDGALQFAGGITGSRGHVGDNIGRRSVHDILAGSGAEHTHPVFGCALKETP